MLDAILIILGIGLTIVFFVNLHYGLKCTMDSFKSSRPAIPPPKDRRR